jgi:type VI secretion system secreted protein Hcp
MIRPTLMVAAAVTAALGAGAVVSAAQSPSPPTSPADLADECARTLPTPAGDAPPTFLKIQGLTGESRAAAHAGESEVDSFRFGAAGGGGSARSHVRTMVIGKAFDNASPGLLARAVTGQHIGTVVVSQDKPAGTFLKYTLTDVQVADYENVGRVARNADRVCLTFATATVEYKPQRPDGTFGGATQVTLNR